jgi:UDP-2,4-diacetamido-2,4,6-trideoxy-beta-L-altropyranose hydrolase
MKVVFRTDSSELIGTGHVMRCLTLAERLRADGAAASFVCRDFSQGGEMQIKSRGFDVYSLPFLSSDSIHAESLRGYDKWLAVDWERDARETIQALRHIDHPDWLVVDHYALDEKWESTVRPYAERLLAIDDIANRIHDCNVLLDHNYGHTDNRYDVLVSPKCKKLLGSRYALLRDEFVEARRLLQPREGYIEQILIFYGGADPKNDTIKALKAVGSLDKLAPRVDVVVGTANKHKDEIVSIASGMSRVTIHMDVARMSDLMTGADVCLGAAGTTSWERCCLGLPTLMTAVAENQISIAEAIDQAGAGSYLGESAIVTQSLIKGAIEDLAISPRGLTGMSQCAMSLVDGLGVQRVYEIMTETREAISA